MTWIYRALQRQAASGILYPDNHYMPVVMVVTAGYPDDELDKLLSIEVGGGRVHLVKEIDLEVARRTIAAVNALAAEEIEIKNW